MQSLDFGEIAALQQDGEWEALSDILIDSAEALEAVGAECIVICANTMHKLADDIEATSAVPLLHIADVTADAIARRGLTKVALLGTAYTMEQEFYRERLADHHGLDVIVPEPQDRAEVHRVIYEELVSGQIIDSSREAYRGTIARLVEEGAQGIILGCTEIALLVGQSDSSVPLFDTTELHAMAAVDFALS